VSFIDLKLDSKLLQAIDASGFKSPTDIQRQAIPVVLSGMDLMASAQTGTGKTAAFVADLIPTTAHVPDAWVMGYDLNPLETMTAKQRFAKEAIEKDILVFFEHDPVVAAGYLKEVDGKRQVIPASSFKP